MNLFELFATISLDSSGYEKGLDEAEGYANKSGSKIGDALKTAAKVATAAIGASASAVVGFTKSAISVGQEFDSNMSQIAATLGLTMDDIKNNVDGAGDTFTALRDKAKEMGAETNFSASEAAQGLNILAMSGFSADKSMDMLADVLHLAAAGSMDMASAAGYISGALKGFNDESKDSAYYANLMAKGATLANTSVSQLGEAMSSGAAGAAAYSQSAESMTVALLRLAEQGEVGSAAGTSLAAAMKNIYTPTDQAKQALDKLGVAAYKNGKALDFNDIVNQLNEKLSTMTEEQANAYKQTIFGIQGLNAFNKMTVTATGTQKKWADALAAASDGAGEAAKQYDTMTDNLQGDIDIWNSAMDGFKIEVSDKVMPTIRNFVKFGSQSMSSLTEAFKGGEIKGAAKELGNILSEGLGMIVEELPKVVEIGAELLSSLTAGIVEKLPVLAETALQIIQMLGRSFVENLPVFMETLMSVIEEIAWTLSNPDTLASLLNTVMIILQTLATSLMENLPALMDAIMMVIMNIVTFVQENLPLFVDMAAQIIMSLANGLIEALPTLLNQIPVIINSLTNAILAMLPKIIDTGITLLTSLVSALPQIINTIVKAVPQIVKSVTDAFTTLVPALIDAGIKLFVALVEALPEIITTICDALPVIIDNVVNALMDMLPIIIDAGVKLFTALIDNLPQIIETLVSKMPEIIGAIIKAIVGAVPKLIEAGGQLIKGLWQGISNVGEWLRQKISGFFGGVVSSIKNFFGIHSPSKVFAGIGEMLDRGLAKGVGDYADLAVNAAEDMAEGVFSATDRDFNFTATGGANVAGATAGRGVVINVYGAEGQNVEELAEIVSQKIAFGYAQEQAVFA